MRLDDVRVEILECVHQLAGISRQFDEHVHSEREVWGPEQTSSGFTGQTRNLRERFIPSGSANYHRHTLTQTGRDIGYRTFRLREFNCNVGLSQRQPGNPRPVGALALADYGGHAP